MRFKEAQYTKIGNFNVKSFSFFPFWPVLYEHIQQSALELLETKFIRKNLWKVYLKES